MPFFHGNCPLIMNYMNEGIFKYTIAEERNEKNADFWNDSPIIPVIS
jgi:hypothetical protein